MHSSISAPRLVKTASSIALLSAFLANSLVPATAFAAETAAKPEVKAEAKASAAPKVEAKAAAPKAEAAAKTDAKATTTAAPTAAPAEAPGAASAPADPSAPVVTDEMRQKAGEAYVAGKAAFDAGDFVGAEAKFREAHGILPSPMTELMIAQSLDKQGKPAKDVVAAYDQFLLNPAASRMDPAKVSEADARAAELRKTLPAKYTFTTEPAGATITIDGVKQDGVTPLSVELPAGKHSLEVTRDGYEKTVAEFEVAGGSNVEQPINLVAITVPVAETKPAETAPAEPPSKVPAYVTLGLGGAGLVAGTIFGILALDSKGKYNSAPSAALADETERNAIIADMSIGLAITLGVTGIVLLTGSDKDATTAVQKPGRLLVAPYGGPTGGGAAARMSF